MLELFAIFSKGGIVLWWFKGAGKLLIAPVNELIKNVLLQEKSISTVFIHEKLALRYRLDNLYDLIYVAAYQTELALSYVDKLLTDTQREFRDKYKNDLEVRNYTRRYNFDAHFTQTLRRTEEDSKVEAAKPRQMKQFHESAKSQKTVASMIIDKNKKEPKPPVTKPSTDTSKPAEPAINGDSVANGTDSGGDSDGTRSGPDSGSEKTIEQKRAEFEKRMMGGGSKKKSSAKTENKKPTKQPRKWDLSGTSRDEEDLDVFHTREHSDEVNVSSSEMKLKGQGAGHLKGLEVEDTSDEEVEEDRDDSSRQSGYGFFDVFKSLSVTKTLTHESVTPVLDKMKDHLIAKNVASDIAQKLCDSVAGKLEGKVIGTFSGIANTVKTTLQESCVQILTPKRRIDILRDAMETRSNGRPYSITFCGVNGVGKSTNLSKVAFWLIENGLSVLIAACDTFRAGAVEQLRTHERKLNTIHSKEGKPLVKLYEMGYDKDAASVAMSALNFARDMRYDVVLIDTAGRMQDNEPLMKSLAKLIKVNQPDLVLFVGEALVGNEAVDQLVKFNQALADHSQEKDPHLIDGIVLTKFDTIDDKVGAAISMTYITGQPIVFVGTGQTYTDLKTLNAKAVVHALMKA